MNRFLRPLTFLPAAGAILAFAVATASALGAPSTESPAELLDVANHDPSAEVRRDALNRVAEVAGPEFVGDLLRGLEGNRFTEKRLAEDVLTRCLRRWDSAQVYFAIERTLPGLTSETRARVIACVGEAGSASGGILLGNLLADGGPLEPVVLSAISKMPPHQLPADLLPEVAERFRTATGMARRECVYALRLARDPAIIAQLVESLSESEPALRGTICWALGEATGVDLPPDERRWRSWLERERAWWESTGKALLVKLRSGEAGEALAALRALTREPHLHDREIDAAVLAMMADSRPRVAVAAGTIGAGRGLSASGDVSSLTVSGVAGAATSRFVPAAAAAPAIPSPSEGDTRFAILAVSGLGLFAGAFLLLVFRRGRRSGSAGATTLRLDPERRMEMLLKSR